MTPPLPPRHGRWRASSRRTWEAWHESPIGRKWTRAQIMAAGRTLRLIDDMEGTDEPDRRRGLAKEVRTQEAALGLGKPPPSKKRAALVLAAPADPEAWREERRAEMAADPERIKRLAMTPDDRARYELAGLQ